MHKFNFDGLFIYDLANNHQGDLAHAVKIVDAMGEVSREAGVRAALKFQFRQLDTFIHPDFKTRNDLKFIKRFNETRLSMDDFSALTERVRENRLLTMCTPFDEESVDIICDMKIELIKIASCSAADRPLLEKITSVNRPVVVSTAGLQISEIDWLVNFFETARMEFAIMHCVAIYPTPDNQLAFNQIGSLRARYPGIPIGWSTHENPSQLSPVQIAYAKGAQLFERHVGINTDEYTLNAYSSTPDQIKRWLDAYKQAVVMCGPQERAPAPPEETKTLHDLKRGVYAAKPIKKGEPLSRSKVFFAMPLEDGQLVTDHWSEGIVADQDYAPKMAVSDTLANIEPKEEHLIYQIMLQVRGLLNHARVSINDDASIEISHHYGLSRFREFGAVIITCVNRSYGKKLLIQLPRQKHPYHYHKKKEETFQLLHGDLEITKNGDRIVMEPGETCLIDPGDWHKFHTLDGAVIEEIYNTHYDNDSFYEDPLIAQMNRSDRKTNVDLWCEYFKTYRSL